MKLEVGADRLLPSLRRENDLRSWSISSLCFVISVLYLGTMINPLFHETWIENITNYHLIIASAVYLVLYLTVAGVRKRLAYARFKAAAPRRLHSSLVTNLAREIARELGLKVIFLSFGSFDERRVIAQVVKSKAIVQIGTGVLPLAALKPVEFRFRLAHEMAHLAANDYRSDRIVSNHYLCFAVCAGASLAAALGNYGYFAIDAVLARMNPNIITTSNPRYFVHLALSAFAATLLFGVVSMLLFAERRATRRARELLADGLAADVTRSGVPIAARNAEELKKGNLAEAILKPFLAHPDGDDRSRATETGNPFVYFNELVVVTHSFLMSLYIDLSLQVIADNAHRRAMYIMEKSVTSTLVACLVGGVFYFMSARLVMTAGSLSYGASDPQSRLSETMFRQLAYSICGTALMLASSQSIWFTLVDVRWPVDRLLKDQWDLFCLLLANALAIPVALFFSRRAWTKHNWAIRGAIVALPGAAVLLVGTGIFLVSDHPPPCHSPQEVVARKDC